MTLPDSAIIAAMRYAKNQPLLGGLTPSVFLKQHWQKKPLYVQGAIPDCGAWLSRESLFQMATRDDVESRLVTHQRGPQRGQWGLRHGPFKIKTLRNLPRGGWSLLVQGLETFQSEAADLLKAFSFVPHARLDDLMASYAPAGGGVGPHFDSYDVFLLQGAGTRRWRTSRQRDLTLVNNAPLRILQRFRGTAEWTTRQGDLLYLPPHCAHEGVSIDDAMTLSVGFRAPRTQELTSRFLEYLQDTLELDGIYQDPDLKPQAHPGELSQVMITRMARMLQKVSADINDVREFAGRYLTEPKPHIVFQRPKPALALPAFARRALTTGVRLALPTRMLLHGLTACINGEALNVTRAHRVVMLYLADHRELPAPKITPAAAAILHPWYRAGYVELGC